MTGRSARSLPWPLVASLVVLLAGCARPIRLNEPVGVVQVGFDGGNGRLVSVMTPFADGRTPPSCEADKLGTGDRLADYSSLHKQLGCSPLPAAWVARRFMKGLEAADFVLVAPGPDDGIPPEQLARATTVRGRLDRIEVEAMAQMQSVLTEADLQVEIVVATPSGLSASRRFHVKAQEVGLSSGPGRQQETLDRLIDRAVREMTAGVVSLLNRYPE